MYDSRVFCLSSYLKAEAADDAVAVGGPGLVVVDTPGNRLVSYGHLAFRPAGTFQPAIWLIDRHPVFGALHALDVTENFGGQVDFGSIPGLATQGDYAILCLDLGMSGAG